MSLKVIACIMCANLFPTSGSLSRKAVCEKIMDEALKAVDPLELVKEAVGLNGQSLRIQSMTFDLSVYRSIHVIGMGKAAPFLFHALKEILGEQIHGGVVVSLPEHILTNSTFTEATFSNPGIKFIAGSHPVPDTSSVKAGEIVVEYARDNITRNDLVICLVSGGASSLVELPMDPFTLEDIVQITQLLLDKGASIREMNAVRKVMSGVKGGKLLQYLNGATIVSLIISDIIGSPAEDIGSGPTVPGMWDGDHPNKEESAVAVLEKYFREPAGFGKDVIDLIRGGGHDETSMPIQGDNHHFIIGENKIALEGAVNVARELKIKSEILTAEDAGDVREAAVRYARIVSEHHLLCERSASPILLLAGGEHTVQVKGDGKGGRNQEFLLALLVELQKLFQGVMHDGKVSSDAIGHFHIMSIGTDGIDGPTDAAGAWIDEDTWEKAKEQGLDPESYLERNDSYTFFMELDQLIITGPTHTNVMDIRLLLLG